LTKYENLKYPDGKDFIFTIFDDTDVATYESIKPVYDYLSEINIKTTKTVWPLNTDKKNSYFGTDTLQRQEYVEYIKELQRRGFEISFHGATMVSSKRDDTQQALKLFNERLGFYPRTFASHSSNRENLYWGSNRFTSKILKFLYKAISNEKDNFYQGHIDNSPYFWGDLAQKHIQYVRSFTFDNINLIDAHLPILYVPKEMPYINNCFISADADNVEELNGLLAEKHQDSLIQNRGICIISTHFGKGFVNNGQLNKNTQRLLKRLSKFNGWFMPVDTVLDFLKNEVGSRPINSKLLTKMEIKWFIHSLLRKLKSKEYIPTELEYLNNRAIS